jgi:hypothetical protein
VQSSLAAIVIKTFPRDRPALTSVVDRLSMIGVATAAGSHEAAAGMVCRLLQADAEIMLGLHSAAAASVKRAAVLARAADLPPSVQAWAGKEIDRLRGRIAD